MLKALIFRMLILFNEVLNAANEEEFTILAYRKVIILSLAHSGGPRA